MPSLVGFLGRYRARWLGGAFAEALRSLCRPLGGPARRRTLLFQSFS